MVPSPIWPLALFPQANTVPSFIRTSDELAAAAIAEAPCRMLPFAIGHGAVAPTAQTFTGAFLLKGVPSPSWPLELFPQASTVPSDLRASENCAPAATAITSDPLPRPKVCTGVALAKISPLPSCQLLLL